MAEESAGGERVDGAAAARETLVDVVTTAHGRAKQAFILFVLVFFAAFYVMRLFVWPELSRRLIEKGATVVAVTPFDVILLQAKIGSIVGIIAVVAFAVAASWSSIREREWYPNEMVSRRLGAAVLGLAAVLFAGGVIYAYEFIFPFLFGFLQQNAIKTGFTPTYSIIKWTKFVFTLTLVMGFAAELPLVMAALTKARIVPYRTFRDHWRHATVAMFFVASIVNGSPDPFSMTLVAVPLVALYAVGLACSRIITATQDDPIQPASEAGDADADSQQASGDADADADAGDGSDSSDTLDPIRDAATGAADAFADEGVVEEDLGGYIYDLQHIGAALADKLLHLAAVFLGLSGLGFALLYRGGITVLKEDFLAKLPEEMATDVLNIVLLHPIEILVFELKLSAVFAAVITLPIALYYAWPAVEERDLASGNRGALLKWSGVMAVGLIAGTAFGYLFVAPQLVSFLVADSVVAGLEIAYRASNFFWLVFLATAGIGLWINVPLSILYLNLSGVLSLERLVESWRGAVLAVAAVSALLPGGVIVMLLATGAVATGYAAGVALVALTRPVRRLFGG